MIDPTPMYPVSLGVAGSGFGGIDPTQPEPAVGISRSSS